VEPLHFTILLIKSQQFFNKKVTKKYRKTKNISEYFNVISLLWFAKVRKNSKKEQAADTGRQR